jgi:hypothetical protein
MKVLQENVDLVQGTKVKFDIPGSVSGAGKICGIANNGVVLLGKGYIIEPDVKIENDVYNYSHIVVFEQFFDVIE